MKPIPVIVAAMLLFAFCSCTTPHKTFRPPSSAQVDKSNKILTEKVARARETATKSRQATLEAQESAKKLMALAKTMKEKLGVIKERVAPEIIPLVTEAQTTALAQDSEELVLRSKLSEAVEFNDVLQQRQQEEESARAQLQFDQNTYALGAADLARDATTEREKRITVEKKLLQQRLLGWLWKVGGGLVLLAVVALVILWLSGKIFFKIAK